jgi:hypothetical protein
MLKALALPIDRVEIRAIVLMVSGAQKRNHIHVFHANENPS